jgi:uncharacterized iron-regulated protein
MTHMNARWASTALALLLLLAGPGAGAAAGNARVLIFGEQHDQPDQQRQVAEVVQQLAGAGRLAAVVLEMAEAPHSTAALARDADEAQARAALQWQGWPWEPYAQIVMNAVRAGVPVWGGNLPRRDLRGAMADASLDARVDAGAREALTEAVRSGHCQLLPASQEPGMVRMQIARDRSIAQVTAAALQQAPPVQKVLLLTGAQHASLDRGVPVHLQHEAHLPADDLHVVLFGEEGAGLKADEWRIAEYTPQQDHCEALRKQLAVPRPASAPAP